MRDPDASYRAYSAAWNETIDHAMRDRLLRESLASDGIFVDDENPDGLVGPAALSDYIARSQEAMPGLVVTETSEPQVLGDRLRVRWTARQDDGPTYAGTDFIEFAADGRLSRVTMFSDDPPSRMDA